MMEVLVVFVFGALVGVSIFMAYAWFQMRKIRNTKHKLVEEIIKKTKEMESKKNSIQERLIQASDLAKAQSELRAQAEMPSKNALHSRHKNGLVHEIQDMEQRKLDILKTILAEGFDPNITVLNDHGQKDEMPLSSYVDNAQNLLNKHMPPPPVDKKTNRFVIYIGGKDDGTSH
jgi:flagellar biosynthesis GTPase FlhF